MCSSVRFLAYILSCFSFVVCCCSCTCEHFCSDTMWFLVWYNSRVPHNTSNNLCDSIIKNVRYIHLSTLCTFLLITRFTVAQFYSLRFHANDLTIRFVFDLASKMKLFQQMISVCLLLAMVFLASNVLARQNHQHARKYSTYPDYDNDLSLWIDEPQVKSFSGKLILY